MIDAMFGQQLNMQVEQLVADAGDEIWKGKEHRLLVIADHSSLFYTIEACFSLIY